jgi:hypothetical protein
MRDQNLEEEIIVHNFDHEEVLGVDLSREHRNIPNPYQMDDIGQSVEEFMGEVELPVVVQKPVFVEKGLVAWCLPASYEEKVDRLYGDVKRKLVYGDKFSFEIRVLGRGILDCTFRCPVEITNNSILYLWEQREWWRSIGCEGVEGQFVVRCYPSDYHPSF